MSDVPLVRLLDRDESVRRGRLQRIGAYASAVGLHKDARAPATAAGRAGGVTRPSTPGSTCSSGRCATRTGTCPAELRSPGRPRTHGDAATEVARLFDLGVDGVLTDFPETAVQVTVQPVGGCAPA